MFDSDCTALFFKWKKSGVLRVMSSFCFKCSNNGISLIATFQNSYVAAKETLWLKWIDSHFIDKVLKKLNDNCNNAHIDIQKDILTDLYKLRELMVEESSQVQNNTESGSENGIFFYYRLLYYKRYS